MIERVIFGIVLGAIGESFEHNSHVYQKMLIVLMCLMFILESSTFGFTYGLMATTELIVGFLGSGWIRTLRLTRGWPC